MLDGNQIPFVSVLLPVRNEAQYIRRSLGSVLAQDYPVSCLEVIVIDGMSTDGTRELINEIALHAKCPVNLIDNPEQFTTSALNKGIDNARGDILVRVDGHCEIPSNYVSRCAAYLQEGGIDAVGGAIETLGESNISSAIACAMSTPFGVGNSAFRTTRSKRLFTDTVPFPAYKKETINKIGGYDETMLCNEDDEYNYRLLKLGGRILLADDISSRYFSRSSILSLWKQYYKYGLWKVRILQKHPSQVRIRQFIPPIFVLAVLISGILAVIHQSGAILLLVILESYIISNLFASVYSASINGWKFLPIFPIIFFVLHFSYGLGFLIGIFKFGKLWIKN